MLISVIIPTYNRSKYLLEAIKSIEEQEYKNIEIIVVDNCSTDDTSIELRKKAAISKNLTYKKLDKNYGAGKARNIGLMISRGEFIQFLDSDDILLPSKISSQVCLIKSNPELDIVVCQSKYFDGKNDFWNALINTDNTSLIKLFLTGQSSWSVEAPLWKKTYLLKCGLFDERLISSEEEEFHLRALTYNPQIEFQLDPNVMVRHHLDLPSMRRKFYQKEHRVANYKSFYFTYLNLLKNNFDKDWLTDLYDEKIKIHYLNSVIENNFRLTYLIFINYIFIHRSILFQILVCIIFLPLLLLTSLTHRNKNILIYFFKKLILNKN